MSYVIFLFFVNYYFQESLYLKVILYVAKITRNTATEKLRPAVIHISCVSHKFSSSISTLHQKLIDWLHCIDRETKHSRAICDILPSVPLSVPQAKLYRGWRSPVFNLVPRVSHLTTPWGERARSPQEVAR